MAGPLRARQRTASTRRWKVVVLGQAGVEQRAQRHLEPAQVALIHGAVQIRQRAVVLAIWVSSSRSKTHQPSSSPRLWAISLPPAPTMLAMVENRPPRLPGGLVALGSGDFPVAHLLFDGSLEAAVAGRGFWRSCRTSVLSSLASRGEPAAQRCEAFHSGCVRDARAGIGREMCSHAILLRFWAELHRLVRASGLADLFCLCPARARLAVLMAARFGRTGTGRTRRVPAASRRRTARTRRTGRWPGRSAFRRQAS